MSSRTLFTFSPATPGYPLFIGDRSGGSGTSRGSSSSNNINNNDVPYTQRSMRALEELMSKWGMLQPNKSALQRYTYQMQGEASTSAEAAEASRMSSRRHFHSGLASDFLSCFFASEAVQKGCGSIIPNLSECAYGDGPLFRELRCSWTSLAPLDRLSTHKVVRGVVDVEEEEAAREDWLRLVSGREGDGMDGATILARGAPRVPIVKRPEKFIGGEIIIADELRALLLDTHSRPDTRRTRDDDANNDDDEEEEEEEDDDYFGFHSSLSRRERAQIFTLQERQEFVYHILWRLVAGGGPMNQFEDDFTVYKAATRVLFRALVTSVKVTKEQKATGDVEDTDTRETSEPVYVPHIQSYIFQVLRLSKRARDGLSLWDATDERSPSNLCFCYVIVNPWERDAILWYQTV